MIYLSLYLMERGANALHVELLGKGNRSPGERGRKRFVGTTLSLSVSTFFFLFRCVSNADKRMSSQAIFHEGSKGYLCCKRRVLEFDEFMKIPGCKEGKHLFVGSKKDEVSLFHAIFIFILAGQSSSRWLMYGISID